jgi:hypothetical protein
MRGGCVRILGLVADRWRQHTEHFNLDLVAWMPWKSLHSAGESGCIGRAEGVWKHSSIMPTEEVTEDLTDSEDSSVAITIRAMSLCESRTLNSDIK